MKMHHEDFEKMRYLVFVKFLSWPSWANSETGFGLSTSKIPILGMSNMQGKPQFFHLLRPSRHPYFLIEVKIGPTWALKTSQRKSTRAQWKHWVKKMWKSRWNCTVKMLRNALPCFCEILIWPSWAHLGIGFNLSTSKIPILGKSKRIENWCFCSPSEAFQAPILFDRGSDGPNLGPHDFSKEKYKEPNGTRTSWRAIMGPTESNTIKNTYAGQIAVLCIHN